MKQRGLQRRPHGLSVALTGILLAFLIMPALTVAETVVPDFPISAYRYDQQNPHAVYLPDKNLWFVVWEDWRDSTVTGANIYGRFVRRTGAVCAEFAITPSAPGNQTVPRVAYRNGAFVGDSSILMIVWQDTRKTSDAGFVYHSTIDVSAISPGVCPSTLTVGTPQPVLFENDALPPKPATYTVNSRMLPKVVYDVIDDRFVMAWVESRTIRKTINYNPFPFPDMTSEANLAFGDTQFVGYAAVWADGSGYETAPTILSQVKDPTGTLNFTRATLLEAFSGPFDNKRKYEFFDKLANVDLACDTTAAECFIAWEGLRGVVDLVYKCEVKEPQQPEPPAPPIPNRGYCYLEDIIKVELSQVTYEPYIGIYGLHEKDIDIDTGAAPISRGNSQAHSPSAGFDPASKRFLVAWDDLRICEDGGNACTNPINASPNKKIFGQLISSGSGPYGYNFIISYQDTNGDGVQDANVKASNQTKPFVSYDPVDQRFFVIWQDGRNTGLSTENLDIFGQKVDGEGSLRGNNWNISTLPYNQLAPVISYNEWDDLFLVVWKDARDADKYTSTAATCNNVSRFLGRPCGSQIYAQIISLGQPSLTLLNPDNTQLAPALLQKFENPVGSGRVDVGLFATQSFKIKNTGDVVLKIDYIDETCGGQNPVPPGDMKPFSFDGKPSQLMARDGVTLDLVPSAEITLTVRFAPTAAGSFNRCFIIESDGGNPTVNLSGFAIEADIDVEPNPSPAAFDFGNVYVGSSKEQIFTVRNTGLANLIISSVASPSAPFTIAANNCAGQSIAPGLTCSIVVRFAPTAVSPPAFNSSFTINSNDPDEKAVTIALTGTGLGAQDITVTPLSIDFGNVQVGQTAQKTVTIRNDGTALLTLNSVSTPASPFNRTNGCGATLAVGASCQINVTFTPTGSGGVSSSITISSDDPDEGSVTVQLSGTGVVTPDIQVNGSTMSPVSLSFASIPVNSTSTQNVTVVNIGSANLNLSSLTNPSSDFSITGSTCAGILSPAASCTITVAFTPTSAGYKQSSFAINTNDPDTPVFNVLLSGTGSAVTPANGDVFVDPLSIDFLNVRIGSASAPRTVKVRNDGPGNLIISSVRYPGAPFNVTSNTCGMSGTLAPGTECRITLVFNPTRAVLYSPYYLTINSNDPDTPIVRVTLSGRGTL